MYKEYIGIYLSPRAKVVKVAARPRCCITFSKLDKSHCRPRVNDFESRDRSNSDPGQMTVLSNLFVSRIRTHIQIEMCIVLYTAKR